MWCGDHTDMGVCTFPAQDMHTRNVSTVLTHHRCTDVKAVSVLCAVSVLHDHTHPYAVHIMCTCVLTDVKTL